MKKRMKKLVSLALATAMATGLLTACGGSASNTDVDLKATTDEYVELKMYLLGDRTPDFDEVYGKINEILKEKLNCTISVDFLSWGEHDTKYSLLFSSEEQFDLIFTASSWGHYEQTVALGGFQPLSEEFIQTFAPDIWDVVPSMAWDQAKIDGQIYMVPNYQNEFGQDVVAVRSDIMQQVGISQITNWDELKAFYLACAENGIYASQGGPWYQYFQNEGMTTTGGAPKGGELVLFNTQDASDLDFYYLLDWPGFTDYCKQMKELADAGCWSPDVLSSTDERQTGLLTGKTAGMIWNLGSCKNYAKQANAENPDWNVTICDPVSSQPKKVNSYINNGVAININSEHKERAMMVLNEFYTNPEVFDLAMLGIEGKHWEAVGDDQYKVIDESNFGVDSNCNWGWCNAEIKRTEYIEDRTALDDTHDAMIDAWNNNVKAEHPYDSFNFDSTSVSTQFAAVEAAIGTYYDPLVNGLVDDVDASIEELRAALESAGIRDILAEMEKQAAEHVKN
ncbi:MAG: ABC transporter substrate-binding protein [Lachnospiraceae bacterium]|nr:ABC transporter substrate-binding protein [Lachnospiraceae bacterium]